MKFYHVTPSRNIPSIGVHGLLRSEAKCSHKCVYVVSRTSVPYAVKHMAKRHGESVYNMTVIEVEIPRRWSISGILERAWRRGVWRCNADLYPCRIQRYTTWQEWKELESA